MRDLYATQFMLSAPDAFDLARQRVLSWCLDRYENVPRPDPSTDIDITFNTTDHVEALPATSEATGRRGWSLTYRHVDNEDPSLGWRVLAQLSEPNGDVRFTLRLSQESLESRVRPALEVPGRPRIVRDLARELGGVADGRELAGRVPEVRSDDIGELVALLRNPARRLPVVVSSIAPETGRPSTDPLLLADHLIGVAHVLAITSGSATYELTAHVGKRLSVFDGAVRIYWPGFALDDDPYLHRLWLGRTVELIDSRSTLHERQVGFSRHLLGLVGGVAALRVPSDPLVRTWRREAEARLRAMEREEWERLAAEQAAIPDVFAEEFDRQSKRIEELELSLEIAEEEHARLQAEIDRIARNFADVRAAVAHERGDMEEGIAAPTTIREALEAVADAHPDAIVCLNEAFISADETRYRHIDQAAAAIRAVGDVAQGWHDNTLGTSFDAALG